MQLCSGETYLRISAMLSSINVSHFSSTLFYNVNRNYLLSRINNVCKPDRADILETCVTLKENSFIGDRRTICAVFCSMAR